MVWSFCIKSKGYLTWYIPKDIAYVVIAFVIRARVLSIGRGSYWNIIISQSLHKRSCSFFKTPCVHTCKRVSSSEPGAVGLCSFINLVPIFTNSFYHCKNKTPHCIIGGLNCIIYNWHRRLHSNVFCSSEIYLHPQYQIFSTKQYRDKIWYVWPHQLVGLVQIL